MAQGEIWPPVRGNERAAGSYGLLDHDLRRRRVGGARHDLDPRFDRVGVVVGDPHCQFYCGVPLITDEGYALGTLCVMDFEPRRLTFEQTEALRRLSRQVLTLLELRRMLIEHDLTISASTRRTRRSPRKKPAPTNCCTTFCQPRSPTSSRKMGMCNQGTYALRQFYLRTFRALRSWPNERSPRRSLVFWTSISPRSTTS